MRFGRFRLRTRVFFGFGVLIALLLGIAAFGGYGLSLVGGEIDKMDAIAGNANRLEELALRIEMIQRGLAVYRIDADAEFTGGCDRCRDARRDAAGGVGANIRYRPSGAPCSTALPKSCVAR